MASNRVANDNRFEAAFREVARERHVLAVEAEAFKMFRRRVRNLNPTDDGDAGGHSDADTPQVVSARGGTSRPSQSPVREAYVETVMAVPHYDAEYGDRFVESVATEFSVEVAAWLQQEPGLPELLKQRLLDGAQDAVERRQRLRSILGHERQALEEASTELEDVHDDLFAVESRPLLECSPTELEHVYADLTALQDRCDDLADRRQRGDLHQSYPGPASAPSLQEYLYESLEHTWPVLCEIAAVGDRIAALEHQLQHLPQGP